MASQNETQVGTKHPALVIMGKQIRKVREQKGVSQEDFAATAGLGRAYYGGVERGERNITALKLMKIAAGLEAEIGQLFPPVEEFRTLLD